MIKKYGHKISWHGLEHKETDDMFTKKQVLQAIEACTNSRDRAMISMLYDGSLRPVDLRKLTWEDVIFDEYSALIRTTAKTGKERAIRLTFRVRTSQNGNRLSGKT